MERGGRGGVGGGDQGDKIQLSLFEKLVESSRSKRSLADSVP